MIKILIKSGYIHYGYQVMDKVISVTQDEIKMLQSLNVKYEVVKDVVKEEKKKAKDDN